MWSVLLEKLVSILDANVLIQETFNYEVEEFKGDPSCVVVPSNNESDYNTMEENIRIYAFSVRLYVNRTIKPAGEDPKADSDRILRNLVDSVLDDFDSDYTLTGMTVPTGYTFINLFALPSLWGYAGREDEYRVAEINIRCRASVDVNAIS